MKAATSVEYIDIIMLGLNPHYGALWPCLAAKIDSEFSWQGGYAWRRTGQQKELKMMHEFEGSAVHAGLSIKHEGTQSTQTA